MTFSDDGADDAVTLRPMTPEDFETWRDHSIAAYAADIASATGEPMDAALEQARTQFAELLPDGLDSERTWLLRVLDSTEREVGTIWIGPHPRRLDAAFVFDIEIHVASRGRGFGRAAMIAAERLVAAVGVREMGLNVFGFNESARRLYDSLGYRVVMTAMTKTLDDRA